MNKRILISAIAILMIVGAMLVILRQRDSDVVYTVDDMNHCVWQNGAVAVTTAVNGQEHTEKVKKSQEKQYLQSAEQAGRCVYKH